MLFHSKSEHGTGEGVWWCVMYEDMNRSYCRVHAHSEVELSVLKHLPVVSSMSMVPFLAKPSLFLPAHGPYQEQP